MHVYWKGSALWSTFHDLLDRLAAELSRPGPEGLCRDRFYAPEVVCLPKAEVGAKHSIRSQHLGRTKSVAD